MRKFRILFILLCITLITGCGRSDIAYNEVEVPVEVEKIVVEYVEVPVPEYVDVITEGTVNEVSNIPALENRKIIYTSNLVLESTDPDVVYNILNQKLNLYNAYIEQENITEKKFTLKIRVKSENLIDFINDIKTTGEVVSYSKSSQDVTSSYSTFESRKEALEAEHVRILELIEVADSLESIIALEAVRVDIESDLNYINNHLTNYDSLIDYSTINLTINLVDSGPKPLPKTENPILDIIENDMESITFKIDNMSENEATIYAQVKLNGVLIKEFQESTPGLSYVTFTVENLESNKEYRLEAFASESDHSESGEVYFLARTDKTFIDECIELFNASIDSVVSVFEFIVLLLVALSPYLVILTLLYVPVRFIYKRYKK